MSQPITPMSATGYAQRALNDSSAQRNLGAMNSGVPPMANMDDGGTYAKPYATNHQFVRNQEHAMQDIAQNTMSGRSGAVANAMGQQRKMVMEAASQKEKDQQFLNTKLTDVIYNTSGGGKLMQFNALMQSPEREAAINTYATTHAMFNGNAPELGEMKRQAAQYIA